MPRGKPLTTADRLRRLEAERQRMLQRGTPGALLRAVDLTRRKLALVGVEMPGCAEISADPPDED